MIFFVSGKRLRQCTTGLWVNITRFVTGAEKTQRHHVEAAFVICLETAELVVAEFRESKLDCYTNPANAMEDYQRQKVVEPTIAECGPRALTNRRVHGLEREGSLSSMLLGTARGLINCLLFQLEWLLRA